ncbi:MAG: tryptophan synthase subunit alpha, partial [Thermoproteota archaeon]
MAKLDNLIDWFGNKTKVIVALSGGVDSALVAYAAFQKLGHSAIAVTADYKTLSKEELETAKQICSEIGIKQILLDYDELQNEEFVKNASDRCFHCRMELGDHLITLAKEHNVEQICIVSLTTSQERMKKLSELYRGYVYLVSLLGTTGVRTNLEQTLQDLIKQTKKYFPIRVYVGFGIS